MCQKLGKFRCRDASATRIADTAAPEDITIEDENTLPATEFRELEELGAMNDKRARDVETFVAASKARWAKPNSSESKEPSEESPDGPFGKLSARPEAFKITPGEAYERMAPVADAQSPAERFSAASKARWSKK